MGLTTGRNLKVTSEDALGSALVTGAGRRIGRAIAATLAADGWHVLIHYNNSRDEAEELASEIRASGGRAACVPCDLADPIAVSELLDMCTREHGPPDVLINNASLFEADDIASLTQASWEAHMQVNLAAPVFLSQAFARCLPQHRLGSIINIIDQRVLRPAPDFLSYTLSKSALRTATVTLAQALAPRIRVNAVAPGPVLQSIHQTPADFEAEIAGTLLQRPCAPEEIADAVRFILAAPAMTGQMITLDSGQHLAD